MRFEIVVKYISLSNWQTRVKCNIFPKTNHGGSFIMCGKMCLRHFACKFVSCHRCVYICSFANIVSLCVIIVDNTPIL